MSEQVAWRRLLFVVPGWFHTDTSVVDDPHFFLHPQGRTNPQAELDATLEAFFDHEATTRGLRAVHPLCGFPARKKWLQEALGIPEAAFPTVSCPSLDEWRAQRRYGAVSIVFSSFYPDNPASMFGHVFLRLHRPLAEGGIGSHLNDDIVNYAAIADTSNPLSYTWRGLAGGFVGRFALAPYYLKLQEYNNLESRDLWEYRLDLSADELERMLLSLWEIGPYNIDYYYLDDNCSFILLALLETASPRIHLTDKLRFWVTPSDSLRVIVEGVGQDRKPTFRPSSFARYLERYEALDAREQQMLWSMVREPGDVLAWEAVIATAGPGRLPAILDAALDFIDFQEKLGGAKKAKDYAALRRWVIETRRQLHAPPPSYTLVPDERDPMRAHQTSRFELGAGTFHGRRELSLTLAPALHDLLSNAEGYGPGMEILFTQLELRTEPQARKAYVQALRVIEVLSLAVEEGGIHPWSWTFALGSTRDESCFDAKAPCYRHGLRGGAGKTYGLGSGVRVFGLMLADAGYASGVAVDGAYVGGEALAGLLWEPHRRWRLMLDASFGLRVTRRERDEEPLVRAQTGFEIDGRSEMRAVYAHQRAGEEFSLGYSRFL